MSRGKGTWSSNGAATAAVCEKRATRANKYHTHTHTQIHTGGILTNRVGKQSLTIFLVLYNFKKGEKKEAQQLSPRCAFFLSSGNFSLAFK